MARRKFPGVGDPLVASYKRFAKSLRRAARFMGKKMPMNVSLEYAERLQDLQAQRHYRLIPKKQFLQDFYDFYDDLLGEWDVDIHSEEFAKNSP